MAMNEKILQRKFDKVAKILNEDGGVTMIEMMGFLRYVEMRYIDEAHMRAINDRKELPASYESLKKKRVGDMNV